LQGGGGGVANAVVKVVERNDQGLRHISAGYRAERSQSLGCIAPDGRRPAIRQRDHESRGAPRPDPNCRGQGGGEHCRLRPC
jgi:hypothetical protein